MGCLKRPACSALWLAMACCGSSPKPIALTLTPGCNPFSTTSECLFPFPSSFFQTTDATSPTGVRVDYPPGIFGASAAGTTVDVTLYNTADGAPPSSPLLAFFAADVQLSNLPDQHHIAASVAAGSPIALVDLDTGARVPFFAEMEENRTSAPDRYCLIIRPVQPMAMGHRHAVILSDSVVLASGAPLPVSPAFTALRSGQITTSSELEAVRSRYEQIFTLAASLGYPRAHIALAWDFMVASEAYLLGPIRAMRAQALLEAGASGAGYASDGGLAYTIDAIKATSTGGQLVEGTFQTTNYINADQQFDWDSNHLPIEHPPLAAAPEYTMYIPTEDLADGGTPLPLGIFGHGLLGTGRGYLDTDSNIAPVIQGMAERVGAVLIATDWTGLSGTNDDALVGFTVANDINQLGEVTDRLAQSLINNLQMTKLAHGPLQQDARIKPADHALIDLSHTLYYGVSLGGIQGASFVSISDEISRGVFAVPGAAWATMFPRSVDWLQFQMYAQPSYPDPLEQTKLLALMQARFDFTDGVNLTRMLLQEPLPGAPAKTVLLQEAIDDCQVPNVATGILARAIGVQQLGPDYEDIYPLSMVATGTTSSAIAQYYLTSDVATYVPPDTDVAALHDNGAHFDLNFLPNAQQQIIEFLNTGVINQHCSGVCDPD